MQVLPHEGRRGRLGIARTAWMMLASVGLVGGSLFASVAPASAAASYDIAQCANGGGGTLASCSGTNYVHGDLNGSKSHWAEGDFVPFQLQLNGISQGSHTVTIQYEEVNAGKHAYDYLGSFDATETTSAVATLAHANANDPCTGIVSGCDPASPTSTAAIPTPDLSGVNADCGSSGTPPTPAAGHFSLWGPSGSTLGTIAYESPMNQSGSNACQTLIDVSFTSPADGSTLVLAWSGHVASELDWGAGTGAGSISGSPYHMWINGLDGSGGARERSLKVSASQPTITTVIKNAANSPVTTVPAGTSIHDTATLTGAASNAGGTVTYELFHNGTCSGEGTTYAPVAVTNGIVPDSQPFVVGLQTYSYKVFYSGDGFDAPATGVCEGPLNTTEQSLAVINVVKSEPTPGAGAAVTAGQSTPITYTLDVTNAGNADASNVVVTDVVPTGTTYVAGSAGPAADSPSYNSTTRTITWTIPSVSAESEGTPGTVDPLTFQVTVNAADAAGSTIVNQAAFTNVNTPNCVAGTVGSVDSPRRSVALTCLTNQVSNPVIVITPGTSPQVTTTTTTVKPTTTTTKTALAFTGSQDGLLGALGAGLVGSGGMVLLLNRRRKNSGKHFAQK